MISQHLVKARLLALHWEVRPLLEGDERREARSKLVLVLKQTLKESGVPENVGVHLSIIQLRA